MWREAEKEYRMLAALGTAALSAGGSLLSGIGAKQASAKQARMQMIADAMAREANERQLAQVNAKREELGRELLTIPETETSGSGGWVDIPGMMAAAEAGGINPITFMQAGGLQAYAHTNSWSVRTGHNAADAFKIMVPEYQLQQASQIPQQHSMLSAVGGALSAGANAFGTQYRADQSYDLQMGKLALGLSGYGTGGSGSGSLAQYLPSGNIKINGGSGSVSQTGALSSLPYPQNWKPGDVNGTNPWFGLRIDPTFADAEAFETRYGDIAQEVAGLRNLAADTYKNVIGRSIDADIKEAWNGKQTQPWSWSTTPAARAWNWLMSPSAASRQQVQPYLPFPGAGPGVTYAY